MKATGSYEGNYNTKVLEVRAKFFSQITSEVVSDSSFLALIVYYNVLRRKLMCLKTFGTALLSSPPPQNQKSEQIYV